MLVNAMLMNAALRMLMNAALRMLIDADRLLLFAAPQGATGIHMLGRRRPGRLGRALAGGPSQRKLGGRRRAERAPPGMGRLGRGLAGGLRWGKAARDLGRRPRGRRGGGGGALAGGLSLM